MENELTLLQNLSKKIDRVLSTVPLMNQTVYVKQIESLETGETSKMTMDYSQIISDYPLSVKGRYGILNMNTSGLYSYRVYNEYSGLDTIEETFTYTLYDRIQKRIEKFSMTVNV